MAGYKQAVLNYDPKAFITFDGDPFDTANFNLTTTSNPRIIIDESGYGNNALFHEDQTVYQGYMLGRTSLIELEPENQYAISLGYNGGYPAYLGTFFPKTYMEIPSSVDFEFPNNGSFSVMLALQKTSTYEQAFRTFWDTYVSPGGQNYNSYYRAIISKGSYFNMRFYVYWNGGMTYLQVVGPDGVTLQCPLGASQSPTGIKHVAYVWNVETNMPTSRWKSTSSLYMNGILQQQNVQTYLDTYPNTNTADSFFIGGTTAAPDTNYSDRTCEDTRFDQIAIFDKALSAYDVQFFYKKMLTYQDFIMARNPSWVVPFNDPEVPSTYGITALVGESGTCNGGQNPTTAVQRNQVGPSNIPGAAATLFQAGGQAYFFSGSNGGAPFQPNGDFTIDFWFTCSSGSRGVLFSEQYGSYTFPGILLQINWVNGRSQPGALQLSLDNNTSISSIPGNVYNDGQFHYVCMIRRGMTMELWLDGVLQSSAPIAQINPSSYYPNTVSMFNSTPGDMWAQGSVSWLTACSSALMPPEIWGRYNYAVIYKINGVITLEGVPMAANIRLYNHTTGQLMLTSSSSSVDGTYTLYPPVNMSYDMMILSLDDANVRYRAYGPIVPSTFDDPPISHG